MKTKSKSKQDEQAQLLDLLRRILPKIAPDTEFAERIYIACQEALRAENRVKSFEKFCERIELPDLEQETVDEVKQQLAAGLGEAEIKVEPAEDDSGLRVDVSLPDGMQFHTRIPLRAPAAAAGDEQEITLKFVSFPMALPGDPEMLWALAKRENMTNDEAALALAKIEEEFWASKPGQKLLRDRVEKSFPEFIARVPSRILGDVGLKRHYKLPEVIKVRKPEVPA